MVWNAARRNLGVRTRKFFIRGLASVLVITLIFIFGIKRVVLGREPPSNVMTSGSGDSVATQLQSGMQLTRVTSHIISSDNDRHGDSKGDDSLLQRLEEIEIMSDVPMPYKYPMHRNLPRPRNKIVVAMHNEHLSLEKQSQSCWGRGSAGLPIFQPAPLFLRPIVDRSIAAKLKQEFDFENADGSNSGETFFEDGAQDRLNADGSHHPWWVAESNSDDDDATQKSGDLPCTAEVQARLFELQNPFLDKKTNACTHHNLRFLVSKLKEGAHGVGSALTLVAHDLLSSIIVGRVLQLQTSSKWYFSSPHCSDAKHGGWDCFFLPVSPCKPSGSVEVVSNRRQALRSTSPVIVKKSFDIDGLSRNDLPSDELFFGPIRNSKCYPKYKQWIEDPANIYIQGTFERAADPRLFYMLAQAMRFLMRAPQPWFRQMLQHHLPMVGISASVMPTISKLATATDAKAVIYVQERGEIAKFREYYNVFGCHNINQSVFLDYITRWCSRRRENMGGALTSASCSVYISGNTPFKNYQLLAASIEKENIGTILSTWRHPSVVKGGAAETERWGANSPASSWIDMFAGVSSTNWICIVQSNWCRVINLLRLTSGRASCGFIDGGALMIASAADRDKYCVVGPYPTKAFSNRIK
jgi:hypothetical protein